MNVRRSAVAAFSGTDQELQCVEMDDSLTPVPEFPYNWQYDGANGRSEDAFQMDIYCRSLLLIFKDSGAVDAGRADVFVDDTKVLTADPHVNGWTHCNPVILLEEKESGWHQVRIQNDTWGRRKEIYNTWFWLCGIKRHGCLESREICVKNKILE